MNTPIRDFVKKYAESDSVRFHMPGHKGKSFLGFENYDITEIDGADVLYSAKGIIKESEDNASKLFGSYRTFYSAEGSSLCIKAMLALVLSERTREERAFILAGRNAHKSFVYACALLDADVEWLMSEKSGHICSCEITAKSVRDRLEAYENLPAAVYLTSPDYLGYMLDIAAIAEVCDEFNVPLLIDNAHGAYLHFLSKPVHPMDLGAYMCCDSAHKTLPVLTGGAYLHLSDKAKNLSDIAENMLSVFASTSPSYLILQSLDLCNAYLCNGYRARLNEKILVVDCLKYELRNHGYHIEKTEPLKLVLNSNESKIDSENFVKHLREFGVEVEFYDKNFVVFMFTCENTENELKMLLRAFLMYNKENDAAKVNREILPVIGKNKMSIRDAVFSKKEVILVENAVGRICGCPTVSCPPAIPVVVSGETITQSAADYLLYLGIKEIEVIK